MKSRFLNALFMALFAAGLVTTAGCAYNVQPTSAPAVNIYTSYDKKIPGKWAVVVDDGIKGLHRDVKTASYVCSAHTYPIDVGAVLATSVRRTVEQLVDESVVSETIPSPQTAKENGLAGSVLVRLDDYQPRLTCQMGFWSGSCTSTVDLSLGVIVRSAEGQTLLSTNAGSTRSADGDAGAACASAGVWLGDATSRATKDVLERLAERIASATALRNEKKEITVGKGPGL